MKALSLFPEDINSRYHLALVYLSQNNTERAKAEFDRILATDPDNVKVLTERGVLDLGTGNPGAAKLYFEKALAIDPEYEHALSYLNQLPVSASS